MRVMRRSNCIKFLVLILLIGICTGCGTGTVKSADGVYKCSRKGTLDNGASQLNYELYYEGDYLTILHSTEKVYSSDEEVLDTFEEAYNNIFKAYEGLEYYDAMVTREEGVVTTDIVINYAKIDTSSLLEIEGEEDNVIDKDGKVRVKTWLNFAKQYGVTCDN